MIFSIFMLKLVAFLFWFWTDTSFQQVSTSPFKTGPFSEGMFPSLQVMTHCNKKAKSELTRTEQSQEQEQYSEPFQYVSNLVSVTLKQAKG